MHHLVCYILFIRYYALVQIAFSRTYFLRPICVKNHNRNDKSDLLIEEAELLEVNPQYDYVQLENGRKIPVSLWDLAPKTNTFRGENCVNNYGAATEPSRMNRTKRFTMF